MNFLTSLFPLNLWYIISKENFMKITKEEIIDFMSIPYHPLDPKIIEEYSFKKWINKINFE